MTTTNGTERIFQPYLHEVVTTVHAPGVALSSASGDIDGGVHGFYCSDRRAVSRLTVAIDGRRPAPVGHSAHRADSVSFYAAVRHLGDSGADPTVLLERTRRVGASDLSETVSVRSFARGCVEGTVRVAAAADLAAMHDVKAGATPPAELPACPESDGVCWRASDGTRIRLRADPPPERRADEGLEWPFRLEPGQRVDIELRIEVIREPRPPIVLAAPRASTGLASTLEVRTDDIRLTAWLRRSIDDLVGLTLCDPLLPRDRFLAAGAPWFLTLFGRDALWAARMLLPLGTDLAAGTLRALARRQGRRVDRDTAEEPGKIMHEMRPAEHVHPGPDAMRLPPLYYGTVDATALFVLLLHDAWRWGMPAEEVDELLPAAERAVGWLTGFAVGPGGFLAYRDHSGRGLANQGWKDSGDSVQFADGRLARAPIALCEVQAYAVAAANAAAALFDAFGRGGTDRLREWAEDLARRFRAAFWVSDPLGDFPAIALDGDGRRVDTITSNLGHLLGTGLLDGAEEALVVARLAAPDMDCGFGLRTMSARSTGYNPFAYHGGSVWTHDTAIAISGLAASRAPGAHATASSLIGGLLAAAAAFDYRMPELYAGLPRDSASRPLPYPAACRPQAWAAAASVAVLRSVLGIEADVPNGNVRVDPLNPSPVRFLDVDGLALGPHRLSVRVADGKASVTGPPSLEVT